MSDIYLWESKIDTSAISFVRFWDLVSEMGLIKRNTARALSVATRKVLSVEENWETLDITTMDLDAIIETFKRLSSEAYNTETINAYVNNFRRALNVYLDYLDDPAGWRQFAASESGRTLELEVRSDWRRGEWIKASPFEEEIEKGPEADVRTYAFRLRSGCVVDLELPIDLSRKDVNRIKTFLDALLLDD
jgi:hypothetical protein